MIVRIVVKFVLSALALLLVANIVPGIHVGHVAAFVAAIVLGLLNAILRPILVILTLPITILTLGLFALVINAFLFWLASEIVPRFAVHGWRAALVGSILYGLFGLAVNVVVHRIGD